MERTPSSSPTKEGTYTTHTTETPSSTEVALNKFFLLCNDRQTNLKKEQDEIQSVADGVTARILSEGLPAATTAQSTSYRARAALHLAEKAKRVSQVDDIARRDVLRKNFETLQTLKRMLSVCEAEVTSAHREASLVLGQQPQQQHQPSDTSPQQTRNPYENMQSNLADDDSDSPLACRVKTPSTATKRTHQQYTGDSIHVSTASSRTTVTPARVQTDSPSKKRVQSRATSTTRSSKSSCPPRPSTSSTAMDLEDLPLVSSKIGFDKVYFGGKAQEKFEIIEFRGWYYILACKKCRIVNLSSLSDHPFEAARAHLRGPAHEHDDAPREFSEDDIYLERGVEFIIQMLGTLVERCTRADQKANNQAYFHSISTVTTP